MRKRMIMLHETAIHFFTFSKVANVFSINVLVVLYLNVQLISIYLNVKENPSSVLVSYCNKEICKIQFS